MKSEDEHVEWPRLLRHSDSEEEKARQVKLATAFVEYETRRLEKGLALYGEYVKKYIEKNKGEPA